jgi:hypothetical protein
MKHCPGCKFFKKIISESKNFRFWFLEKKREERQNLKKIKKIIIKESSILIFEKF